jgi:DNA-damage-inducible protein J
MSTVQLATRIDAAQSAQFRDITKRLGTTPADALRVLVTAFNRRGGFPFDVRVEPDIVPFETEEEALDFVDRNSKK